MDSVEDQFGGFLSVPISPTGDAYVLLAALGHRRVGRRLGLDRFLEIGIGNTRDSQRGLALVLGETSITRNA
jgi:hypothetical protein